MIRIGLVDFDTSHVEAFTKRFNHVGIAPWEWVSGARVVAGCPGDSEIMPERIPGYTEKLKKYGVEIVANPTDLLGKIDAVMIESQQGRRHLERARPFLEAGLPTFVDKPFAETLEQVDAMIALAQKHNAPLLSCSALHYDPKIGQALARQRQMGKLLAVDVWGTAQCIEGNPGLLHYGIHRVQILYALLGAGCRRVQTMSSAENDVISGEWEDGYIGSLRGVHGGRYRFGFMAHYERGSVPFHIRGHAYYRELLKAFVTMCETRKPAQDYALMREVMAFIVSADRSEAQGGVVEPLP